MIVTRLQGGLGNQLFQYAAGKALAAKLGMPLKVDCITTLDSGKTRNFELDKFETQIDLASIFDLRKFILFPSLYRHCPNFFAKIGKTIFREKGFHFDNEFFNLDGDVYLDGYWQSPKYFINIEDTLYSEFEIRKNLISNVLSKSAELQNSDTISVHIRRGDFLNSRANAYHGILPVEYYRKAINTLRSQSPNSTLCFFSDDIDWVKEQFKDFNNVDFISSFTKSAIEDFFLMSSCRHNIIANSSFSWWAAWLNKNPNKMVIAPTNWFAVSSINTNDLIPSDWLRI